MMIKARHLSKLYNKQRAVNDVSLEVEKGQIFGLLGPNAAGKTTLIRMLCGIVDSSSGTIQLNNQSITEARSNFGYVAQHFGQYEELSVWENLKFYAQMYNVTDEIVLHSLLQRYALTDFKDRMAGNLSGGYQRRLALACALAHDPDLLFLDEPTAGIDPVTRKLLWDDFYLLSAQGKTLFVTTHYMEEAQRCHQLAFMAAGSIIATGTPETIKESLGDVLIYSAQIAYLPALHEALKHLQGMVLINQFGEELRIAVKPQLTVDSIEAVISSIIKTPFSLTLSQANLEDVFIALTQDGVAL